MNAPQSADVLESPAAQAELVAGLCRPEAYAALHPVAGPVRCIETHVSWVFLTGQYAYKVKKPLRLSFLDYSTPARREMLCNEELRLNRRHAPDLYVDVVAIDGTPAQPRVRAAGMKGAATAFEHALRMIQFDPALELGRLLQRGDIAADACGDFGARIARMQSDAALLDPASGHGTPESVQRITLANFAELGRVAADQLTGDPAWAAHLEQLQARARALFAMQRDRMQLRRQQARVREGHGDLHCGNVVLWQGALVAFDGIEFDPALRWIDVASDIAFLTMDLAVRGHHDLRRAVLQGWITESGDFDALALMPYFELYRALVRAKVAALRSLQHAASAADCLAEARGYLEWAARRSERTTPTLIVMAGLSGSGKTWLARRIAARIDALVVRSDIERKRLAGLQPLAASHSAPDAGLYSLDFNARTYARLGECVSHALEGGASIVVDAANLRRAEREQFLAIARRHGARAAIVHCTAPIAVLRERVATRAAAGADASEATTDLLDRQPGYWEAFGPDECKLLLDVDTSDPAAVEHALQQLGARTNSVQ